jgi:hypothetical protein
MSLMFAEKSRVLSARYLRCLSGSVVQGVVVLSRGEHDSRAHKYKSHRAVDDSQTPLSPSQSSLAIHVIHTLGFSRPQTKDLIVF